MIRGGAAASATAAYGQVEHHGSGRIGQVHAREKRVTTLMFEAHGLRMQVVLAAGQSIVAMAIHAGSVLHSILSGRYVPNLLYE